MMKTVNEVSRLTGVSIRTLHYYHTIGLLHPSSITDAGYRLYDDTALERLQQILLFRELEFPLREIRTILESRDFDRNKALEQQITLLTLKKEHLENLITFARGIQMTGVKNMNFDAFDTKKIDEYTERAKKQWGNTPAYHEFEEKSKERSREDTQRINHGLMDLFREFGMLREQSPLSDDAGALVKELQNYITDNFYTCTDEILSGLGKMYADGGEFTASIDSAGGSGTAAFAAAAIAAYCGRR